LTVQNTLQALGFEVNIKRFVHWEIAGLSRSEEPVIFETGMLFNARKEYVLEEKFAPDQKTIRFLVTPKENIQGEEVAQMLQDHFSVDLQSLKASVLWEVTFLAGDTKSVCEKILATHIFYNPYAHECYHYV